ncbi:MAG: hypothetical protein AAF409_06510 [Pseudomonadota bacterium]
MLPQLTTARLWASYRDTGVHHCPRTHSMDGERVHFVNQLIEEAFPDLIQQAHNPVDWRP